MRRLRLLSTAERFVSLSGWRSAIELTGSRLHPLTVSSWDPGRGGPDPRPEDGRAFILARGSSMTAMTASFSHLGFGDGRTSGVAWAGLAPVAGLGTAGTPATGAVTTSTFKGNRIGAYSDQAPDMSWTRNQFLANHGHGFDAHSGCRALVLDGNTASGNGGHGFLLARGCRDNLLQGNHAVGNAASGIVLGNGAATAAGASGNTVISNTATDNATSGLVVDGGTGNRLRGNTVRGGGTGIEIRNSRANPVEGNTVSDVKGPGIDLDGGAANKVTGNRIERSHVGLYLKRAAAGSVVSRNQILASAQFGIYLSEGARGNRASKQPHQGRVQRHPGQGRPGQPDRRQHHRRGHRLRHQPPRRRPRHPGAGQPGLGPGRPLAHRAALQPGRAGRGAGRGQPHRRLGGGPAGPGPPRPAAPAPPVPPHGPAVGAGAAGAGPAAAPAPVAPRRVRRWYKTATTGRTDA